MTVKCVAKKLEQFLKGLKVRAYDTARSRIWKVAPVLDDALDIVQETMYEFTRYAEKPEQEWGPIFHRILNNKIVDYLRTHMKICRLIVTIDDIENKTASSTYEDPDAAYQSAKIVEAARKVVAELPPQQFQVYYLTQIDQHPISKVATMLGIAVGTVKKHRFDAMKALRKKLSPYFEIHLPSSRRRAAMKRR